MTVRSRGVAAGAAVVIIIINLILLSSAAAADDRERDAEWYRSQAREAILTERYERAFELLEEARERYPEEVDFALLAADLFFERELYERALAELRRAQADHPDDGTLLHRIADTLGRLNRDHEALEYYERLLEIEPDSAAIAGDAGWTYFKTQNSDRGVAVLEDAVERIGPEAGLKMTLGTLYADLYEYERSRSAYREAVELAREQGRRSLESVALYNLSLLERTFLRYEESFAATEAAVEAAERPSGYIARGQLYRRRLEFEPAERDLRRAYALEEETPLPAVALSELYRRFGMLDRAIAYAESVAGDDDVSWLYRYGSDTERHAMDVHEALYRAYRDRYRRAAFDARSGFVAWVRRVAQRIHDRVRWWYHEQRYRMKARSVADRYLAADQRIDGLWLAWRAQGGARALAERALQRSREAETAQIPQTEAIYRLERALLRGDAAELHALRSAFDGRWFAVERERVLGGLIEELPVGRSPGEYDRIATELYLLNPGGVLARGRPLPAALRVEGAGGVEGRLAAAFERAGIRLRNGDDGGIALEVVVEIDGVTGGGEGGASGAALAGARQGIARISVYAMADGERSLVRREELPAPEGESRRAVGEFAEAAVGAITVPAGEPAAGQR